MNIPDIVILVFILAGAIRGYFTGFVLQIFTFIAFIGGIWVCVKYNSLFAAFINKLYSINNEILPYISFFLLFIIILIIVQLIGMLITKMLDITPLGITNRLAGAVLGLLKFIFIASILMLFLNKFDLKYEILPGSEYEKSKLYKPVEKVAPWVLPRIEFDKFKKAVYKL